MASPGYDEYRDVVAVILNRIGSSLTRFKPSSMIPWLESTDGHDVVKSPEDERKLNLIDTVLERMVMNDLISEIPTSPGVPKKFRISPHLSKDAIRAWERYTSTRGQNYQWVRLIFETRSPNHAMIETLAFIERYLKETQTRFADDLSAFAQNVDSNGPSNLTNDTRINLHGPSSADSGTTTGLVLDAMPLSTSNSVPPPTTLLSNSMNGQGSDSNPSSRNLEPGISARTYTKPSEATSSPAATRVSTPGFHPTNIAMPNKISPSAHQVQGNTLPARIPLRSEPPPIATFISFGLARLRDKFPDDEFEATFDGDLWLIKCIDCEQGILRHAPHNQKANGLYRPNYQQGDVNNFETHLNNRKHTENVTDKLARLGRKPAMTADVRTRRRKVDLQKNLSQNPNPTSFDMPTFPTERQFKAFSARETALSPGVIRPPKNPFFKEPTPVSQTTADADTPSLMVTLGPFESLKRPSTSHPESTESVEMVKRRRLSYDLLENIQTKNEALAVRVEKVESILENFKKKDEDMGVRVHNLGAFNQTLYDNTEVSRKRIDGLEILVKATAQDLDRLTQSTWSANSRRDEHIEELKRSIAAIPRLTSEADNLQIEQVMSKVLEMEENFKQLQEECTSYKQQLGTATQAEQEMRDRLLKVQKLALRQAEAMKDVNREKEETEKRFDQLEAMIKSQAVEKNGWSQSFRTAIDRNTDEILNFREESATILARVEKLENERDDLNAKLLALDADKEGSTRAGTRRSGGRRK